MFHEYPTRKCASGLGERLNTVEMEKNEDLIQLTRDVCVPLDTTTSATLP